MRPPNARHVVFALLVCAVPAAGQVVRGDVVTRDSVPVRGAVVVLVDSGGFERNAVLTDSSGAYELRAPRPGTYRLRVDVVGYTRVISFPFELGRSERRLQRIHLADATQRLAEVQVKERTACDVRPTEGTQVALLWIEARKSLEASRLSSGRTPLMAYDQDLVDYDSAYRLVRAATRTSLAARADEGYVSLDPKELRQLGYVQKVGLRTEFVGPDARVLLSDDFLDTHCFNLVERDPTSPARVGLRFTQIARARRGYTGIAGTLWLDRETFALHRVVFTYHPRQSDEHPDTTFGGSAHFLRLANGAIVIPRWELRTPVFLLMGDGRAGVKELRPADPALQLEKLDGVRVARGVARAFDEAPSPLPRVTATLLRGMPAPACDGFMPDAKSTELPGTVHDNGGRPASGVRVRARFPRLRAAADTGASSDQWAESGTDANGRFILCQLPLGVELTIVATNNRGSSEPLKVTLTAGMPQPLKLKVSRARSTR